MSLDDSSGATGIRDVLLVMRDEALADKAALRSDVAGLDAAITDSNSDDEHDPEGATLAFERSFTQTLGEAAQVRLQEVESALARVDSGSYGRCEKCSEPIPIERLEARPTATTCLGCVT